VIWWALARAAPAAACVSGLEYIILRSADPIVRGVCAVCIGLVIVDMLAGVALAYWQWREWRRRAK
jgi:hypothetical protein